MARSTTITTCWRMVSIHLGVILCKAFTKPTIKKKYFASRQEACHKDVERCFGVLQARFSIIRNSCRQWSLDTIAGILFGCCIFHNMIMEDERDVPGLKNVLDNAIVDNVALGRGMTLNEFTTHTYEIENANTHYALRGDLIEHSWALNGTNMHD